MDDSFKEKVILFGTGNGLRDADFNGSLEQYDVVAIADSNPNVQGFNIFGYCIIGPEQINNYYYDFIYITTVDYYDEIRDQLINNYEISKEKIRLVNPDKWHKDYEKEKKKVQFLRNAVIEMRLDSFKKNNTLIEIVGQEKERNAISLYWSAHTVHDGWFISAEESYEYCLERFNMYPQFREFSEMDRDHSGDFILDYGCGPGNDMVWLLLHCKARHVIGMDVSGTALRNLQFRLALHDVKSSNARLIQIEEAENRIPLEDNSIDFVNCQGVLMHTSNPVKIIEEFYRVLKKGKEDGKSCANIMVYNKNSIWYHLYAAYYLRYIDNRFLADLGKDRVNEMTVDDIFGCSTDGLDCPRAVCWTEKEFANILQQAGFGRVEYKGGYPNSLEPVIAQKYITQAVGDSRLEEHHKDFLRKVSFSDEGYPMYNGKLCCVGGVYRCYI